MVFRIGLRPFVRRRGCAGGDPLTKHRDLRGGERFAFLFRWHPFGKVGGRDSLQDEALCGIFADDGRSGISPDRHHHDCVQTQSGLLLQGTVAREAPLLQKRLDLLRVVDWIVRREIHRRKHQQQNGSDPQKVTQQSLASEAR